MSHYAKIEDGIVTQVIVAERAFIDSGAEGHYHGKFYIWDEDNTQWI